MTTENNKGYLSKGSTATEMKYNDTAQKIDTHNNHLMPDFEHIPVSSQMPNMDQKRPTLSIHGKKEKFIFQDNKIIICLQRSRILTIIRIGLNGPKKRS